MKMWGMKACRMKVWGLILCVLFALPLRAETGAAPETIVAGLSQSRVAITTDFVGSEILIYGAVKRESRVPEGSRLEVIVTVEGPPVEMLVRRKDRVFGIWINNAEVRIDRAPSFYAIATTGPLRSVLSATEDLRHRISIPRAIRAVGTRSEAADAPLFIEALVRLREGADSYTMNESTVRLAEDTLFRTDIALPANLTEGDYRVRIFLTRGGKVVDTLERGITVRKAGLERFFYRMAKDEPLIYGLLSLVLAAVAGWAASAAFQLMRP
jgi:uncharacterized protein (TIGR02186 family)